MTQAEFTLHDTIQLLQYADSAASLLMNVDYGDATRMIGVLAGIRSMLETALSQLDSIPDAQKEETHAYRVPDNV